jgi:hypothetical protein
MCRAAHVRLGKPYKGRLSGDGYQAVMHPGCCLTAVRIVAGVLYSNLKSNSVTVAVASRITLLLFKLLQECCTAAGHVLCCM